MQLLTWNIHKGKGAFRGVVPFADLIAAVSAFEPDVVALQEVFHPRARPRESQSARFATELGMEVAYVPNATYPRGDHGNATLSRLGPFHASHHDISTNPIEKRGLLHVCLDREGRDPVHVLNTHLGLNAPQRRRQVRRIAERIREDCPSEHPVVLVGDFNDWTGRLDARVRRLTGLRSATAGLDPQVRRTWPAPRPVFGLDRVYFRGFALDEVEILRGPPWDRLSDHLPIRVRLTPAGGDPTAG